MIVFEDKAEQYMNRESVTTLFWMFSGAGENNEVSRKVLIMRLSDEEFKTVSTRSADTGIEDALRSIFPQASFPEARVVNILRSPHYSVCSSTIYINDDFDTFHTEMNNVTDSSKFWTRESVNG